MVLNVALQRPLALVLQAGVSILGPMTPLKYVTCLCHLYAVALRSCRSIGGRGRAVNSVVPKMIAACVAFGVAASMAHAAGRTS